ncbi:ABC transporter ATP-binding protein [Novosphingobium album (ex Liu et al. 2023)]|uniref:ATP-binding cassette domain-containing protein n=1 Tax=Novosphingobium album (ex Liu et al. 2023) TaxID=3031130 RepID=A0ABT5WUI9_9SPHN|nr:ATP-binding cassette domain-containing protein [Novosphingobium album (ex Liu et al. 2023)]MDE8653570.1 ATP-binding cassette domain-containing protein [Novosphingobium album (ex Liu et al. 2023)]
MSAVADLLLSVDGVTVDYSGFKALDAFSMTLNRGETRVVIGPNGAGKSTLCDTIIGRVRPSDGRVIFRGEDISRLPEPAIVGRGICRKFQAPGVLPMLSVRENLALAARRDRRWWKSVGIGIPAGDRQVIEETLELVGLAERADIPGGQLAHGEKQWLEIGMVMATGAELLLLDEPTAGMGPAETSRTAELILGLGAARSVLVIDHDMSFVEQLGAPVTVMHQGRFLKQGSIAEVRADPDVAAVYLGHAA